MSAAASSAVRSGGFTLSAVWYSAVMASSVRNMWCGVTSQVTGRPSAFAARHQIEPALGGDVLDVQRAPGQAAERDVAGDLELLALGRPAHHAQARGGHALVHLAVGHQRRRPGSGLMTTRVELVGVVHDAAHHAGVLDAVAVVGERRRRRGRTMSPISESTSPFRSLRAGAGHHARGTCPRPRRGPSHIPRPRRRRPPGSCSAWCTPR